MSDSSTWKASDADFDAYMERHGGAQPLAPEVFAELKAIFEAPLPPKTRKPEQAA